MFAKLYWRTPLVQVVEWCGWNNNNDYFLLQLFWFEFYFTKLYWRAPLVQVLEWCGWNNNNDYLLLQLFLFEFYFRETLLENIPSPSGRVVWVE
jgi:hypothetical protein